MEYVLLLSFFFFQWYLSFLPHNKGLDTDCKRRSVLRSLHMARSVEFKVKNQLVCIMACSKNFTFDFYFPSQITVISYHSTLPKLKLLWPPKPANGI